MLAPRFVPFLVLVLGLTMQADAHTCIYKPTPRFQTELTKRLHYHGINVPANSTDCRGRRAVGTLPKWQGLRNMATLLKSDNNPMLRQFVQDHVHLLKLDDATETTQGTSKSFTPNRVYRYRFTVTTGLHVPPSASVQRLPVHAPRFV